MVVIKDYTNMFWGVTIDAGKRYSQVVNQGFHVSMAALEYDPKKSSEPVQVMLQHESSDFLLCTLSSKVLQQALDLNFATGEQVTFSLNGSGLVHLTGYVIPEDEEPDFDEFSESEDEEVPSLVEASGDRKSSGNKRKAVQALTQSKKIKLLSDAVEDEDDDDSEDEDYKTESEEEEEEGFSDDFEDDSFGEDDSDIVEDENDDDDDLDVEKVTPSRQGQKNKSQTPTDTPASQKKKKGDKSPLSESKPAKDLSASKQKGTTPTAGNKQSMPETPATPANGEGSEKKKKKKKKKKKQQGEENSMNESMSSPGPGSSTPKTESVPKKRVVSGGTIVEDLKMGHGPEAKPGKMVSVYYVGTLAKNSKRFDSCTAGKPFRFRLNQGEVIKGWDNGVNGMKVGGKRKITVPANQGYGNVKQGPIPPNSTLVFEVELKAVS